MKNIIDSKIILSNRDRMEIRKIRKMNTYLKCDFDNPVKTSLIRTKTKMIINNKRIESIDKY